MQKFKKYLVQKMDDPKVKGSSVWVSKKEFPNGGKITFLNVGKVQVAFVAISPGKVRVCVPDMSMDEVSDHPDCLSKEARSIMQEIHSYLN